MTLIRCGDYLEGLVQTAATAAPDDAAGAASLRAGRWALYWRRSASPGELAPLAATAAAALEAMAAASTAPRWADTDADNASRLAAAIRDGRVLFTDRPL